MEYSGCSCQLGVQMKVEMCGILGVCEFPEFENCNVRVNMRSYQYTIYQ